MTFPRTWRGWRTLFWLSIECCPIHHRPMSEDWPTDPFLYCFHCDGVGIWPRGALNALRMNKQP
jgi:hypothetical protein